VLAVAAALLDRHELTGEEFGPMIGAAITAAVVSTPDATERGCRVGRSPAAASPPATVSHTVGLQALFAEGLGSLADGLTMLTVDPSLAGARPAEAASEARRDGCADSLRGGRPPSPPQTRWAFGRRDRTVRTVSDQLRGSQVPLLQGLAG
jgi:hypothetical protein